MANGVHRGVWWSAAQARHQALDVLLTELSVLLHEMLFTDMQLDECSLVCARFEDNIMIQRSLYIAYPAPLAQHDSGGALGSVRAGLLDRAL